MLPQQLSLLRTPLITAPQPAGGILNSAANFVGWTLSAVTAVPNAARSPDGKMNAVIVKEDAANSVHYYTATATASFVAQAYTFTSYAKAGDGLRNYYAAVVSSALTSTATVGVSLTTGAITSAAAATNLWSLASAVVTPLPQGWFKVALTFTVSVDTSVLLRCHLLSGASTTSYAGDSGSNIQVWGIDLR